MMFQSVGIIGFGLIGSSIAHNIRDHHLADRIVCVDQDPGVCRYGLDKGLADQASTNADHLADCDLLILCVPVGSVKEVIQQIKPHLKNGAIITDVGSVKTPVIRDVMDHLPAGVSYVPGHPMAGTEFSGPQAGFSSLFTDKKWLLTPVAETPIAAVQVVEEFCAAMGAQVHILPGDLHDQIVAMTSHLPQLISYIVMNTADDLEAEINHAVLPYSANGFHGFARIAASDPVMWRDIYLTNRDHVLAVIDRFEKGLSAMKEAIAHQDQVATFDYFSKSRDCRLNYLRQKGDL